MGILNTERDSTAIGRWLRDLWRVAQPPTRMAPCNDFRVLPGFKVQLSHAALVSASRQGGLETLVGRATHSILWAAFARGYEVCEIACAPSQTSPALDICAEVAMRAPSLGWDDLGRPCEEWPS